jgi:predicted amidophosphoribosyltransferase
MAQALSPQTQPDAEQHDVLVLQQRQQFQEFMAECSACQEEVDPHWQFCAYCGTRMATECPGCGTPLPPAGAYSCLNCGLEIPKGDA